MNQPRCPSAVNPRGRGDGPRRGDRRPLLAKQLCNPDLAPARWELLKSGGVSRTWAIGVPALLSHRLLLHSSLEYETPLQLLHGTVTDCWKQNTQPDTNKFIASIPLAQLLTHLSLSNRPAVSVSMYVQRCISFG